MRRSVVVAWMLVFKVRVIDVSASVLTSIRAKKAKISETLRKDEDECEARATFSPGTCRPAPSPRSRLGALPSLPTITVTRG